MFRITVRESFTIDLADYLVGDIKRTVEEMIKRCQLYKIPLDKPIPTLDSSNEPRASRVHNHTDDSTNQQHEHHINKHGKSKDTHTRKSTQQPVHMGIC